MENPIFFTKFECNQCPLTYSLSLQVTKMAEFPYLSHSKFNYDLVADCPAVTVW